MMGTKMRHVSPLPNLSLEELVPKDSFYRRPDAMLDLSFVRELVSISTARPLSSFAHRYTPLDIEGRQ
jgi:hypothetical protein